MIFSSVETASLAIRGLEFWRLLPPQERGGANTDRTRSLFQVALNEQRSDSRIHLAVEF